jgi:hypothetical protein
MNLRFPSKKQNHSDRPAIYEPRYTLWKALTLIKKIKGKK